VLPAGKGKVAIADCDRPARPLAERPFRSAKDSQALLIVDLDTADDLAAVGYGPDRPGAQDCIAADRGIDHAAGAVVDRYDYARALVVDAAFRAADVPSCKVRENSNLVRVVHPQRGPSSLWRLVSVVIVPEFETLDPLWPSSSQCLPRSLRCWSAL
jgi:hypothetical protein